MFEILLICAFAFVAFFVKGVVGAASAIVFNALLLVAIAIGANGELSLADGLYWLAIADMLSSGLMWLYMRKQVRLEPLTVRLLLGMIPTVAVFAFVLTRIDVLWLSLLLSLAIVGAGLWLAWRNQETPMPESTVRKLAFPTGLLAGVLGGLFGMAGPVFFLLLQGASSDPSVFRRRAVLVTVATNPVRLLALAASGAFEARHVEWFGYSVPGMLVAMLLGGWLHKYVKPRPFRVALGVLVALAGIGGLLRYAL